jgi:hypothetical protein
METGMLLESVFNGLSHSTISGKRVTSGRKLRVWIEYPRTLPINPKRCLCTNTEFFRPDLSPTPLYRAPITQRLNSHLTSRKWTGLPRAAFFITDFLIDRFTIL